MLGLLSSKYSRFSNGFSLFLKIWSTVNIRVSNLRFRNIWFIVKRPLKIPFCHLVIYLHLNKLCDFGQKIIMKFVQLIMVCQDFFVAIELHRVFCSEIHLLKRTACLNCFENEWAFVSFISDKVVEGLLFFIPENMTSCQSVSFKFMFQKYLVCDKWTVENTILSLFPFFMFEKCNIGKVRKSIWYLSN